MTNPGNAIGTNAAFGGRTTPNAFNDALALCSGRGIITGWACEPVSNMTVALGGTQGVRDVACVEDDAGNKLSANNISGQPVQVELEAAPTVGSRIDCIVAYVQNPPQNPAKTPDNPQCCGIVAVQGDVAVTPVPPTEEQIRAAITEDGGSGATAYYAVLATISIPEGATDITIAQIEPGKPAGVGVTVDEELSDTSENPVQNKVISAALGDISTILGELNSELTRIDTGAGVTVPSGASAASLMSLRPVAPETTDDGPAEPAEAEAGEVEMVGKENNNEPDAAD